MHFYLIRITQSIEIYIYNKIETTAFDVLQ